MKHLKKSYHILNDMTWNGFLVQEHIVDREIQKNRDGLTQENKLINLPGGIKITFTNNNTTTTVIFRLVFSTSMLDFGSVLI